MSLQGPWYLLLALLAIPLVVVYFLKLKRQRVSLSSLVLWRQVMADERVNAPFQRFKRNLLLLLQLLVLAFLVLAAVRPTYLGFARAGENVPILIDVSASMAAPAEAGGPSRLELAKDLARDLIAGANPRRRLMLIAVGRTPRRLTGFTDNPRILHAALDRIHVTDTAADLGAALRLVGGIGRADPVEQAVLVSDGNLETPAGVTLAYSLDYRVLPPGGGNAGIADLTARRLPNESWEVLLRIVAGERLPSRGRVELASDGAVVFDEELILPSGDETSYTVRIGGEVAQELEARFVPAGFDALAVDDRAWLRLPRLRPLRVGIDADLVLWRRVMRTQPGLRVVPVGEAHDLVITGAERGSPAVPVRVFVGRVPAELSGHLGVEEGHDEVADWQRQAPVLNHVVLDDVVFGQRVRWDAQRDALLLAARGYEVLVHGGHGPILLRRETDDAVSYYFLPRTDISDLPFRVGFPVLASNLAAIARRRAGMAELRAPATGVLPPLTVPPSTEVTVVAPDGTELTKTSNERGILSGIAARRAGRYAILVPDEPRRELGVSLLDAEESRLGQTPELELQEVTVAGEERSLPGDQPLWKWLACLMVVCMLWEWWYFARPPRSIG